MGDRLVVVATAVMWGVTAVRTVGLRGCRKPAGIWLWGVLLCLSLAFTLFATSQTHWLERRTGVPQLPDVLARTAVLGAAACAQSLLRNVTSSEQTPAGRRALRGGLLTLALALMWVAFAVGTRDGGVTFGSHADLSLWSLVFIGAFTAYLAFVLVDVMLSCIRFSAAGSGPLATGLRIMALGCAAGLGYLGVKVAAVAMAAAGAPMGRPLEAVVGLGFVVATGVLIALGSSWSALRRRGAQLMRWREGYRVHRELYPLWCALMGVEPALALDPARNELADRCRVRGMDLLVYRRVIEVRDARLELRDYLDARVARLARSRATEWGWSPAEVTAYSEAKLLESGILSALKDERAMTPSQDQGPDDGSVASEVAWWLAVARHFRAPEVTVARPATRGLGTGRLA